MRLWMIRHGKTAGNLERRYIGGRTDQPLCPQGRAGLGEKKSAGGYPPCRLLISSPMRRCLETCEILYPGIAPVILEDLRETDFGLFEGLTYEEIALQAGSEGFDLTGDFPFPQGESRSGVRERTWLAFEAAVRLAGERGAGAAVIVCHGGVMMSLLTWLMTGTDYYAWHPENGCGFGVEYCIETGKARLLGKIPVE